MLARLIGLFFLIPLIFFYLTKQIKKKDIYFCSLIFLFILFQGIIGWYMVKSGLVHNITVSHYRLSIHLTTAIIIISMIFWLLKNLTSKKKKDFFRFSLKNLPFHLLVILIFFQIIIGAFVSGLDAGMIYQTWPKMGSTFIPNDLTFYNFLKIFDFDNHSLVQFYHRILAYFIILYVIYLSTYIYKKKLDKLYAPLQILILFLSLQVLLGIFTLISGLNIYLASSHQIIGVLLVLSVINLYYFATK
tara:strand:- start:250 stop:987 length:738 start_codon:yes stop_codon:yes gene_type:complete